MLTAIVGGTLIDGLGGDPIRSSVVVVENGRIIASGSEANVAIPAGAKRLDASGRTILPGFIDTHVHSPQLDVIASYDKDGRVVALDIDAFTDKEMFLHTDHFAVLAVYAVKLKPAPKA